MVVLLLQVAQVYMSWKSVSFAPIRQLVGVQRVAIAAGKTMGVSSYMYCTVPFWISVYAL